MAVDLFDKRGIQAHEINGHRMRVWHSATSVHGMCLDCDFALDAEDDPPITERQIIDGQRYLLAVAMNTDCQ